MTNFFEELEKYLLPAPLQEANSFKIILLKNGAYLEGHTGLLTLSQTQISFKTKKENINFIGNRLFIAKLDKDSAIIKGVVLKVERGALSG